MSTCWITRGTIVGMGCKPCPHAGQRSRRWSSEAPLIDSGGKAAPLVLGVAGLAADAAALLALRRGRLGRLDDVGGRRLGGVRGILAGRGELLLEAGDGGLERLQPRLLGVQLRLQTATVRARLPCLGSHGRLCYMPEYECTTPVQLLVGPLQGLAQLGDDLGQKSAQMVNPTTSRRGLRTVEYEAWQTPLS